LDCGGALASPPPPHEHPEQMIFAVPVKPRVLYNQYRGFDWEDQRFRPGGGAVFWVWKGTETCLCVALKWFALLVF
jgi:hypothetical protein